MDDLKNNLPMEVKTPKILLVTASIGQGHVKAAAAVAAAIKAQNPAAALNIVDFTQRQSSWANALMKAVYLLMLRFVPDLYNLLYRFSGGRYGGLSIQSLISVLTQPDIKRLVKRYQPDVVVCTHPFPAGAVSWYRKDAKRAAEFKAAVAVTDYSIHQMWIYPNIDRYFVARETMKSDLIAAGFAADAVAVTGIPVAVAEDARSKAEIAADLGIDFDLKRPVVLVMGGGLGLGGVINVVEELEKIDVALNIFVVCGQNENLFKTLTELAQSASRRQELFVWGYTEHVHELMRLSALLVSKPGALSISEALYLGLPMVLHSPIPGPETENAVYIARRGAALWLPRGSAVGAAIAELLSSDEKLHGMVEAAEKIRRPHAAAMIADAILNLAAAGENDL